MLTPALESARMEALSNQIRYVNAIGRVTLRRLLMRNDWDVNRAAEAFRVEEDARANSGNNNWADDHQTSPSRTVGGSRLRAVQVLRQRLTSNNTASAFGASRTTMLTLLQQNGWNVESTASKFERRSGNIDDVVDRTKAMRLPQPHVLQRDERLAASFISLTSIDSWYSAIRFLEEHGWNYTRAVDAWCKLGHLPHKQQRTKVYAKVKEDEEPKLHGVRSAIANRIWVLNEGIPGDSESDVDGKPSSGPSESSMSGDTIVTEDESIIYCVDFDSTSSLSELDTSAATNDRFEVKYGVGEKDPKGYIIDLDRGKAVLGCPDASKMRIG
jgi:hypothetical protein